MDFIEKIFGLAPDGGDGSFEVALFLIPLVLITTLLLLRSRRSL